MNLDHFIVVSLDGSVTSASDCFVIDSRTLNDEQHEILEDGTDKDRAELAQQLGYGLGQIIPDA